MKKRILSLLMVAACAVFFGASVFAGQFDCSVDTNYEYGDIYVEAGEADANVAYVKMVNESDASIFIGNDSVVNVCDINGQPQYELQKYAEELVEIVPGDAYYFQTAKLPDNTILQFVIPVADSYGNLWTFVAAVAFAN